jgi:molecular chaperone GrpE
LSSFNVLNSRQVSPPRLEKGASRPKFDNMQEETVQPQNTPEAENAAAANRSLEELLAETQAKLEQQREQMLRTLAETENVRKRLQSDAANAQKYALERFAEGLLPVVDSLEAALKSADVSGIEVIVRQLKAALEKASIREINPAPGERFDPHREQAMAAVEADAEPNTIVAVMQKGYSLHDRVLRPALVTVAKPPVEKHAGNPISDTDLD